MNTSEPKFLIAQSVIYESRTYLVSRQIKSKNTWKYQLVRCGFENSDKVYVAASEEELSPTTPINFNRQSNSINS